MAFQNPWWEVRTTGNDTNNGGGFDFGAAVSFPTDGAATSANTASPVFTSASYNFVAGDVGAWIFIKSGTNWIPGWYKIVSVAANAATLDAAVGHAPLFLSVNANSTIGLNATAGMATVASPTTATWGVDYSQQDTSRITFTDMVIDGTTNTKFTSAANPVGKNFIGNIISVTSGTGFTVQRVLVVSTVTTTATCDKSLGTLSSTGGNGRMGGALASVGLAASLAIAVNSIFVKNGSYSITSASTNVTGGCVSLTIAQDVVGYNTFRWDMGVGPTLTASGIATTTILKNTNANGRFVNFIVNGASLTSIRGFDVVGPVIYCTAQNCTNSGFTSFSNSGLYYACYATGCGTAGAAFLAGTGSVIYYACEAIGNTVLGFSANAQASPNYMGCIAGSNTGASTDGFSVAGTASLIGCTAYGNGRDGIRGTGQANTILGCIAEGNVGWGINVTNATNCGAVIDYCATFNNNTGGGTGAINTANDAIVLGHNITYTATAFVNAAGGNFALSSTSAGGGALRAKGWPGTFQSGLSLGYTDIGAVQAPTAAPGFSAGTGLLSQNVGGIDGII